MQPVWLDKIIEWTDTAGHAEPVVFAVSAAGVEIYRGRLLCINGKYTVNLSELAADLYYQVLPACLATGKANYPNVSGGEVCPGLYGAVSLTGWYLSNEDGQTADFSSSVTFLYDWSYDDDSAVPARDELFVRSEPIDGYLHPMQFVIFTSLAAMELTLHYVQIIDGGGDFNNDFNLDFFRGGHAVIPLTTVLNLPAKSNTVFRATDLTNGIVSKIRVTNDLTDKEIELYYPGCSRARYVLHYVNAYGGWDSFVPRGVCRLVDGLKRSEYTRRAVNANGAGAYAPARGRTVYDVDVARRWEMKTAWLTEAQAARMFHLLESPEVWLYDTVEQRFTPVVVNDTDCEHKTHAGEGRKLIAYTLTVTDATGRARR